MQLQWCPWEGDRCDFKTARNFPGGKEAWVSQCKYGVYHGLEGDPALDFFNLLIRTEWQRQEKDLGHQVKALTRKLVKSSVGVRLNASRKPNLVMWATEMKK